MCALPFLFFKSYEILELDFVTDVWYGNRAHHAKK
jgi:hypothetical protein